MAADSSNRLSAPSCMWAACELHVGASPGQPSLLKASGKPHLQVELDSPYTRLSWNRRNASSRCIVGQVRDALALLFQIEAQTKRPAKRHIQMEMRPSSAASPNDREFSSNVYVSAYELGPSSASWLFGSPLLDASDLCRLQVAHRFYRAKRWLIDRPSRI